MSDRLDRKKTYHIVSQTFWRPRMCKNMSEGESFGPLLGSTAEPTCTSGMLVVDESRLRLRPAGREKGNTGILIFICRLSKMMRLAPVRDKVTGKQAAQLFLHSVFRYHDVAESIASDRDPRFTGAFWDTLFQLLGIKLTMSTAIH
ncbi:Pol protein [Phytophthora palmivora]|uniref:Pol protein n=1 Tax=Phytophthora palmivora TaxID=4796 RepID=A0A2P4XXK9_9STRA|nr:Pol protein [Phytophthora palmivora]